LGLVWVLAQAWVVVRVLAWVLVPEQAQVLEQVLAWHNLCSRQSMLLLEA